VDWYWEIQRDGQLVLSYEETEQYLKQRLLRSEKAAGFMGGLAGLLLVAAVVLRKRFGAWRDG
jgi:hypothetical protein